MWLEIKGCTLTHGARALAKHANRSSSKYWGSLKGSGEDLFEFELCRLISFISFSHWFIGCTSLCKMNFCMLSNVYNHPALWDRDFLAVVLHWPISLASVKHNLSFSVCLPNTNFLWDLLKQILQIIYYQSMFFEIMFWLNVLFCSKFCFRESAIEKDDILGWKESGKFVIDITWKLYLLWWNGSPKVMDIGGCSTPSYLH